MAQRPRTIILKDLDTTDIYEEEDVIDEESAGDSLDSFRELGLSETTIEALAAKGFEEPTAIQKACIPLLLKDDRDVVGQASTGTGKTATFALPILEILDEEDPSTQALVLAPTRELAVQVADEIASLRGKRRVTVEAIYGGASYEPQFKKLKRGVQIVVGTPGRIQDHIDRGTLDISRLKFAVLDEADEMLDMGFVEDIEKILSSSNSDKRMLLFSATMPDPILSLAERFMRPGREIVRLGRSEVTTLTEQYYVPLRESDKMEVLTRIIDNHPDFYAIVFCRTKVQCEEIGRKLAERGYAAEALHGDLSQKQRELILQRLRDHKLSVLVATDVAARGIDVSDLTHVVNYNIPGDPEVYVHRAGRTGRAGKTGMAITFVTPQEKRKFNFIQRVCKTEIKEYQIPSAEDLISAKKERVVAAVMEKASGEIAPEWDEVAARLLDDADARRITAALLSLHYGKLLDKCQYHPVSALRQEKPKRDKAERKAKGFDRFQDEGGMVRLFVAVGRRDGFTKRDLANAIIEECRVNDEDLQGIQVMERFSFVNVPSRLAPGILDRFLDRGEDGKPLVVVARPEDGQDQKSFGQGRNAKPGKGFRKGWPPSPAQRKRRGRGWEDEVSYYGRDTRDDDDGWTTRKPSSKPPYAGKGGKRKEHGKYSKKR